MLIVFQGQLKRLDIFILELEIKQNFDAPILQELIQHFFFSIYQI
jgi:hypothetical protein